MWRFFFFFFFWVTLIGFALQNEKRWETSDKKSWYCHQTRVM